MLFFSSFFGMQNLKLCMTDTDSLFVKVTIPPEKLKENPEYNIYDAISENIWPLLGN